MVRLPRRAILSIAALLLILAGCGGDPVARASLSVTFPAADGVAPLTITIDDPLGAVAGVAVSPRPANGMDRDGVAPVAGRPSAIRLTWLAGTCERRGRLAVARGEARLRLELFVDRVSSCTMAGVSRQLDLDIAPRAADRGVDFFVDGQSIGG